MVFALGDRYRGWMIDEMPGAVDVRPALLFAFQKHIFFPPSVLASVLASVHESTFNLNDKTGG